MKFKLFGWFRKDQPVTTQSIVDTLVSYDTGFDDSTGERNTIVVDASQAQLDAHYMRESAHFLKTLQDFRDKYLAHMRRGDPRDPAYPDYVAKLQGIEELTKLLFMPIAIDED